MTEVELDDGGAPPLAAVDIGTNSFHLVVARASGNNRFEVLDRDKQVVRLGSGSGDMKRLSPEAMDRGIEVLNRFRTIADSRGAELVAVATSAVREAENRNEFIRRARSEAGVRVDVVTGAEEARLIHLGVLQAVPVFDRRHLVIDIGGGSTEFVVGQGVEVLHSRSLKLGAIRLTDRFLRDEPLRKKQLDACRTHVRSFLAPAAKAIGALGFEVAVGSSGTIVSVAEIARALAGEEPLRQVSGATITAKDLKKVVAALTKAKTSEERAAVPGIDTRRVDIIVGGVLVLEQAFEVFGIDELVISDNALREGLLLDVLRRRDRASLGHLRDLRYDSVAHLAEIAPAERSHAEHATKLAVQLFDATLSIHGLDEEHEELLEAAGMLANVGLFVSHDRHHLHSYYIIRNTDVLAGFTDHEIELIAQVARYHRKSPPRPRHTEFAKLDEADQRAVRVLAGMLRVAYALDRTRAGVVSRLIVDHSDKQVEIAVRADGDVAIELYSANERKALLEDALGRSIVVRAAGRTVTAELDELAEALAGVGRVVRDAVGAGPIRATDHAVVRTAGGDDIFGVDERAEDALLHALAALGDRWPGTIVMEGHDEPIAVGDAGGPWRYLADPVDGSRPWLAGKRSAWVLLGAGRRAETLDDLEVGACVELAPDRAAYSIAAWATSTGSAHAVDDPLVPGLEGRPVALTPRPDADIERSYVTVARFAPGSKAAIGAWEDELLRGYEVYEDSYLCSGGQLMEVALGRELAVFDPRPLLAQGSFAAHPYDIAAVVVARAAGVIVERLPPGPLDYPLDTTTPVAWAAYANEAVAARLRPR